MHERHADACVKHKLLAMQMRKSSALCSKYLLIYIYCYILIMYKPMSYTKHRCLDLAIPKYPIAPQCICMATY
jgi:hypothetical protein